jgi:murein DD-endopeptidase MepM/ murein hydrolase activator NlpD
VILLAAAAPALPSPRDFRPGDVSQRGMTEPSRLEPLPAEDAVPSMRPGRDAGLGEGAGPRTGTGLREAGIGRRAGAARLSDSGGRPSTARRGGPSPAWEWPLAGARKVLRRFDPPPQRWLSGHRGADLAAQPGQEVHAAGAGRVQYVGVIAGRGVVTIVHDNGLRTTYLPVRASVRSGDSVAAGDVIGVLEDSGGHCPMSCLHLGLLQGDRYLDPLLLFGQGQVRLLPLWSVVSGETARARLW